MARLTYKQPPGRPSKLTKTQRRALAAVLKAGPQAAGDTGGCWNTPRLQDLIQARLVSPHLNEAKRLEWRQTEWPRIVRQAQQRQAQQRQALLLFGDEASCAQWGALGSTWAPTGEQPAVRTSSKRKGYKVCGLMDYFSRQCFYKAHEGRWHSESSATFLLDVWSHTRRHVVVMQDGARYHTSAAKPHGFDAHADRLTIEQSPAYSPDVNPIEHLWKKVKKAATHRKYCPECTSLPVAVDRALLHFAHTPSEITVLMARCCAKLGAIAAHRIAFGMSSWLAGRT